MKSPSAGTIAPRTLVPRLLGLLLMAGVTGTPSGAWPNTDTGKPVAVARAVLISYDAAVYEYKRSRGHNVTLGLENPMPEVLAGWRGVPLPTACGWLTEHLVHDPADLQARPLLAQLLGRQGKSDEAARVLEAHVERHPADADGWNALGVACARLPGPRALARKLTCYEKATSLDPKNAGAWANLCNARAAAGRPREAVEAGLRAVALRQHYVYAWMNLGVAYGLLEDGPREKDAYRHSIEVPADFEKCPFARFNLALCYEKDKAYAEAVRWYQDALRVGLPEGPRSRRAALFHYNLGRALYLAGQYVEATRAATEALKIDPKLPEPTSLLGHLFEKAGQKNLSRKMFVKATQLLAKYGPSQPDEPQRHGE
jgi:Flp pilus assembly protein TadD